MTSNPVLLEDLVRIAQAMVETLHEILDQIKEEVEYQRQAS